MAGSERNPWESGEGRSGEVRGEREGEIECDVLERRKKAKTDWADYVIIRIRQLLSEGNPLREGWRWDVRVGRVVTVKSYAPFVDHVVVDVECRPVSMECRPVGMECRPVGME